VRSEFLALSYDPYQSNGSAAMSSGVTRLALSADGGAPLEVTGLSTLITATLPSTPGPDGLVAQAVFWNSTALNYSSAGVVAIPNPAPPGVRLDWVANFSASSDAIMPLDQVALHHCFVLVLVSTATIVHGIVVVSVDIARDAAHQQLGQPLAGQRARHAARRQVRAADGGKPQQVRLRHEHSCQAWRCESRAAGHVQPLQLAARARHQRRQARVRDAARGACAQAVELAPEARIRGRCAPRGTHARAGASASTRPLRRAKTSFKMSSRSCGGAATASRRGRADGGGDAALASCDTAGPAPQGSIVRLVLRCRSA
jgi:hypothetical protein